MSGFIRSKNVNRKRKQPGNEEKTLTNDEQSPHGDHITIVPLNMKNMVPEMVLLGSIKEIHNDHIVVLLPDNIHGYVYGCDMNEYISSVIEQKIKSSTKSKTTTLIQLSEYFHIGQFLCCTVVSCGSSVDIKANRLRLSIKPSDIYTNLHTSDMRKGLIMWGYVSTKEDHGYEISFGSQLLKGFYKSKKDLKIGHMSFYVINSEASTGRLYLVNDTFINPHCFEDMPFSSILPGNRVKCLIVDNQPLGSVAKVFSTFDASIANFHLNNLKPCSINSSVEATVLFVDPLSKRIGLSVSSHLKCGSRILNNNGVSNDAEEGDNLITRFKHINKTSNGNITKVFQHYGVVMEMEDLNESYGILTKSWMKFPFVDGILSEDYSTDSTHKVKIINYNPIDNVYMLSDKHLILSMPYITYEGVKIGSIIKGEVLNVSDSSITMDFGGLLRGILPIYLTKNIDPKKVLMEHKSIKCRVVECDVLKAKLLLTASVDMLNDKTAILDSYQKAKPGMSFVGFVLLTKENYCIVKFYNNVTGILYKNHVDNSLSGKSFISTYKQGKILKVFVYKCVPSEKTLHLTLQDNSNLLLSTDSIDTATDSNLHLSQGDDNTTDGASSTPPNMSVTESSSLTLNVLSYENPTNNHIKMRLAAHNEYFKKTAQKKNHPIPMHHLSDFIDLSSMWYKMIKRGGKKDSLDKAAILGRNNDATMMITLKKCFLNNAASNKLPMKYEDLSINQTLPGIILNYMPNGMNVLVGFSLVGLLPITAIAHEYISSLESMFSIGQTILVTINELSPKSKRFTLVSPFKVESSPNKTYCDYAYHGVGYLESYLEQRASIEKVALMEDSSNKSIPTKAGEYVDVVVKKTKTFDDISCKLMSHTSKCKMIHLDEFDALYASFKPAQQIQGLVVANDFIENVVYVVPSVLKRKSNNKNKSSSSSSSEYKVNQSTQLTIVSVNDHHITCVDSKEQPLRTLFYGVGMRGFGDLSKLAEIYTVGQSITGIISKISSNETNKSIIFTPDTFKSNLLTHGDFEPCKVNNINGCFVYVHVKSTNQLGRVHVSEVTTQPIALSNPLDEILVGSTLNGAIIGQVESNTLNRKSFKKHSNRLLEMSFISNAKNSSSSCDNKHNYNPGDNIVAYVKEVQKNSVILSINPDLMAIMDIIEFMNYYKRDFDFKSLKPGVAIHCVIQSMVDNVNKGDKQIIFNVSFNIEVKRGASFVGRVIRYLPNYGQRVKLSNAIHALLPITEVCDEFVENPQHIHPIKSIVQCVVINMESCSSRGIVVSTKKSLLGDNNKDEDGRSKNLRSKECFGPVGSTYKGYIKYITNHYALIMLSFNVITKIRGREFTKWFTPLQSIKNIKLPALVSVKILSKSEYATEFAIVDVKLTMNNDSTTSSTFLTDPRVDPCNRQTNSSNQLHMLMGKCVEATIQKIDTQIGLHLTTTTTTSSNVVNLLVPLTLISDNYTQFPMNKFKPSQTLKVLVVAQSRFKNTLLGSLRDSSLTTIDSVINSGNVVINDPNFDNTFELAADQNLKAYVIFISPNYITVCVSLNVIGVITQPILEMIPPNKLKQIKLGNLLNVKVVRVLDKNHIEVCLQEMGKKLTDELTSIRTSSKPTKVVVASNLLSHTTHSSLANNTKDVMRDIAFLNDDQSLAMATITKAKDMPISRNKSDGEPKFDNPLEEEKFIREREKAIVDGSLETTQDYERECLSNPNDSQQWIRYIAFIMDTTGDMEQARHIVKRSLNVINYREENDRFNMWICLLNLENEFGTEQSMDEVYKQACQLCDKKQLLQRLTSIYYSSGKLFKAEELHNILIKKFAHSKKSWLLYLQFLYQNSRLDDARKLLPRALRVLDKQKHVDCLVKNGLLEFKYGDAQRAASIFDGILKNYPNRIDIWFVLIDQHVKQSNTDLVRELFERLLSVGLNTKRIKSVFKKYADYEKALPDHLSRFNDVQEKALEYLKLQNSSY